MVGRPRLTEAEYQSSRIGIGGMSRQQQLSSNGRHVFDVLTMSWKQSSGIVVEAGWRYSYCPMSNSPSSLSPLLLHEDNARSCLSTSPRVKRTSHLARTPLLLRQNICRRLRNSQIRYSYSYLIRPVFSHHYSLSQLIYSPPPLPLKQLPQVDIVVLFHNHYDHT